MSKSSHLNGTEMKLKWSLSKKLLSAFGMVVTNGAEKGIQIEQFQYHPIYLPS
jgi:hypothetical protein